MRTLVFAYGRMNPPTIGHLKLVQKIKQIAHAYGAPHLVMLSHTVDKKRNPLSPEDKLYFAKIAFPYTKLVTSDAQTPSFMKYLASVSDKYDRVIFVAGSDRVEHYRALLNDYNGKDYSFSEIEVVSAGERTSDEFSASRLREFASVGDYLGFSHGVPQHMGPILTRELFRLVRKGMGFNDEGAS